MAAKKRKLIEMSTEDQRSFNDVFEQFVASKTAKGVEEVTIRNYYYRLKTIQRWLDTTRPFDEITIRDIDAIIVGMRTSELSEMSTATYDALCSICNKTGFSKYEDHGYTLEKTALERTGDKSIRKFLVTTVMDMRVMDRLRKSLRDPKSGKYGVYCQPWQVPYWKAVFGDTIAIRTIPEELLPHIDLNERQRRAAKSAARSTEKPNFDVLYEGLYPDEDEERNDPETDGSNSDDMEIDWDNVDIDWDNIDVDWDNVDIDLKARDWSDQI